jgi:hypothetical protein
MTLFDDIRPTGFLRRVLAADATTCVATGLLLLFGASALEPWLGIPPTLMRSAGTSLLPIAAFFAYVATRDSSPRVLVWAVIAGNAAWSFDSVALLFTGWIAPTALGIVFIVAQALVVALVAELEYVGLRRSTALREQLM